jgi:hypothetical protein
MKKIQWLNGNKMKFSSEHKTFDNQCRCIMVGNQLGDVVLSSYVRAYIETECNGIENEKGHLQEWDLNEGFLKDFAYYVKDWIRKNVKKESVIAYEFRHFNNNKKIIDGYVITDNKHKLLNVWYEGNYKNRSAVDEAIKYITE